MCKWFDPTYILCSYLLSIIGSPFSHFFFLMIRPPPRFPLFPSTTLFRSRRDPAEHAVGLQRLGEGLGAVGQRPCVLGRANVRQPGGACHRGDRDGIVAGDDLDGDALDRKSTRLNSSHLVISYAVFCLKQK